MGIREQADLPRHGRQSDCFAQQREGAAVATAARGDGAQQLHPLRVEATMQRGGQRIGDVKTQVGVVEIIPCQRGMDLGEGGDELALGLQRKRRRVFELPGQLIEAFEQLVHRVRPTVAGVDAHLLGQRIQAQPRQFATPAKGVEAVEHVQRASLVALAEGDTSQSAVGAQDDVRKAAALDDVEPVCQHRLRRGELVALHKRRCHHRRMQARDHAAPVLGFRLGQAGPKAPLPLQSVRHPTGN